MSRMIEKIIGEREKGAAPVSIATSLALEGLFAFGEHQEEKPQDNKIDELWVNLRTLFRNTYGSVDRLTRESALVSDLIAGVLDDMQILHSVIDMKSKGRIKLRYYVCDLTLLPKEFPNALIKEPKTVKQMQEHDLENILISELLHMEIPFDVDVYKFGVRLEGVAKRVALLTHHPVDLLSRSKFSELYLLESHTGKLKPKTQWYTKLTNGKKLTRIPFNKLTIQILGDNNQLFRAMSPKIKKVLFEMAENDKWSPATTMEKVRYSINKLSDKETKDLFLSLL